MGQRPPKICTCGRKVPAGVTCQCKADRARARPSAAARGYGSRWKAEAAAWLASLGAPKCEDCGKPANTVAHRIAWKGDMKLMWDRKNWKPSCGRCNAGQCASVEGGFGNPVGGGSRISSEAGRRPGISSTRDSLEMGRPAR